MYRIGNNLVIVTGMMTSTTSAVPAIGAVFPAASHPRVGNRRKVRLEGRLTWRDNAGTLRFASVVTQDMSDLDAFVECQAPASIPLYRLVHFQLERTGHDCAELPSAFQQGKVLSAVYRVGPRQSATGTPRGYALRLLVDPAAAKGDRRRHAQSTN